jgi:hypothetical protein
MESPMPLHRIEKAGNHLQLIEASSFVAEEWLERKDLQPLLRENPAAIDDDLLIIGEEFNNWDESLRRIDLSGLDTDGNTVVIELKRQDEGAHMELQAIRYAAMVSIMDFDAVAQSYESLLEKQGKERASARESIKEFLGAESDDEITITNTPRIILVAPSFSREITTTVLWLNDRGLDIRCIKANLYNLGNELYLNTEQIIPLPSAADYQVKVREKTIKAERKASNKQERSLKILVSRGYLKEGTRLYFMQLPRVGLNIPNDKAKYATYVGNQKVRWDYDKQPYSLSSLCKRLCIVFGGDNKAGPFQGPKFWAIEGDEVSLAVRASKIAVIDDAEERA